MYCAGVPTPKVTTLHLHFFAFHFDRATRTSHSKVALVIAHSQHISYDINMHLNQHTTQLDRSGPFPVILITTRVQYSTPAGVRGPSFADGKISCF